MKGSHLWTITVHCSPSPNPFEVKLCAQKDKSHEVGRCFGAAFRAGDGKTADIIRIGMGRVCMCYYDTSDEVVH